MLIREFGMKISRRLSDSGIESARFESRQLLKALLSADDRELLENVRQVTSQEAEKVERAVEKRISGYPLQYLLGEWEFFSLPFFVGEGVLIPRQDTETLCEYALSQLHGKEGKKIIDLCSGSGCIAIVLEHFTSGNQVFALEKSKQAVSYLKRNIQRNQSSVVLLEDDALFPQTEETDFDMIVSNPPYLSESDMQSLQKEVSYEPPQALYADRDGYFFYEELTALWKQRLKPGGILIYEVGAGQADRVEQILKEHGFSKTQQIRDLCGISRVVAGVWK